MAKNFDAVLDAGMNAMKSGAIRVAYCSAEPANALISPDRQRTLPPAES